MRDVLYLVSKLMLIGSLAIGPICITCLAAEASNAKYLDSLEDLLRHQSDQLTSFEYLLQEIPSDNNETIEFTNSFEDLLRRQANLLIRFDGLMNDSWSKIDVKYQRKFLLSYADLVRREIGLYSSFETLCRENWPSFSPEIRVKFLASFEDLLRRMSNQLNGHENLLLKFYGNTSMICDAAGQSLREEELDLWSFRI